jgi:hypothetical protein
MSTTASALPARNTTFVGEHLVAVDVSIQRLWRAEHDIIGGTATYRLNEEALRALVQNARFVILRIPFHATLFDNQLEKVMDILFSAGFAFTQSIGHAYGNWRQEVYLAR